MSALWSLFSLLCVRHPLLLFKALEDVVSIKNSIEAIACEKFDFESPSLCFWLDVIIRLHPCLRGYGDKVTELPKCFSTASDDASACHEGLPGSRVHASVQLAYCTAGMMRGGGHRSQEYSPKGHRICLCSSNLADTLCILSWESLPVMAGSTE